MGVITAILDNCGDAVRGVTLGQDKRQRCAASMSLKEGTQGSGQLQRFVWPFGDFESGALSNSLSPIFIACLLLLCKATKSFRVYLPQHYDGITMHTVHSNAMSHM